MTVGPFRNATEAYYMEGFHQTMYLSSQRTSVALQLHFISLLCYDRITTSPAKPCNLTGRHSGLHFYVRYDLVDNMLSILLIRTIANSLGFFSSLCRTSHASMVGYSLSSSVAFTEPAKLSRQAVELDYRLARRSSHIAAASNTVRAACNILCTRDPWLSATVTAPSRFTQ